MSVACMSVIHRVCIGVLQKKAPRESVSRQLSTSSSGTLSPGSTKQTSKHEWKYIASEKTSSKSGGNSLLW